MRRGVLTKTPTTPNLQEILGAGVPEPLSLPPQMDDPATNSRHTWGPGTLPGSSWGLGGSRQEARGRGVSEFPGETASPALGRVPDRCSRQL